MTPPSYTSSLSIYLYICPSIYLSIYLCICPSIYRSLYLCIYLSIYLSYLSIYLSIYLSRLNKGDWHHVSVKWMSGEVWLNLDYGQFELTQRTNTQIQVNIYLYIYHVYCIYLSMIALHCIHSSFIN